MVETTVKWLFFFFFFFSPLSVFGHGEAEIREKKTYVVHMDKTAMPESYSDHIEWYSSMIKSVVSETHVEEETRILYTYQKVFHGVAARLSKEEAGRLEQESGVVAVIPERRYELHTTRSPTFLGLERRDSENTVWEEKLMDHDVIVGVLDTGIWPESQSFNDTGMSPVPATWRGACETGRGFTKNHCNRKIVGARVFYKGYEAATGKIDEQLEYKSPRDRDGHGTHTAATVAGSPVRGANLLGYAYGTARGMAPRARIAAYKVCWVGGCFSSDILSAVDRAVADGVHVLSISLGGGISTYYRDSLSIAAFGAMEMGVFVSCSAGNGGPDPISLTNVSPWITTVGASTMDRDFPATVNLGSGRTVRGVSLYKGTTVLSKNRQYPLVYMGSNASSPDPSSFCLDGALDRRHVAGKIVICDRGVTPRVQKGQVVREAGGIGMILTNTATNGEELVADCHLLPAVAVGEKEGKMIKQYAMTSRRPTANLQILGTRLGIKPSPVVAAFSSRGPNFLTLEILKPDLVAPGVNILAAWTGDMGPSSLSSDHRRVKFNILSGTSMSCPHVSGVAALIKARHPDWSPAAIKSALLTTAYVHDNNLNPLRDASTGAPSTPYDHGAGHINPLKALDPGLVYDIGPQDYFEFLCTQDLSPSQLKVFSRHSNRICRNTLSGPGDLNYAAISAVFTENTNVSALTLHRTVTNVGPHVSSYKVVVSPFKGASVIVEPKMLNFTSKHQKLSYRITFRTKLRQKRPEFGGLVWRSSTHKVRSPIVVTWLPPL
ncbi:PREDICTED: subtilisin-like protease SBT1.3 isoform X2 [Tarenaya hassleriana]|uniref:subtilisin-like protease SBT1.3 isoform X1 n=1 Tax=Tarenaya hassleriana TaxID=28532 RepID=UPI00053C1C73|nr:PREDICTED: subtilisin-like protease SBT1.3 isoform X1 [Tarenaya hassleriana]XP_010519207.1 PREDICTED: subtilisin-like protease SBT1.3 isoform X2 [Tarenaya hassleriana]